MTDYNDGKWHTWAKAEKPPLHDLTRIERVFINSHGVPMNDYDIGSTPSVGATSWSRNGVVLAFRVTKEHKEPREFWVDPDRCIAVTQYHAGFILVREVLE